MIHSYTGENSAVSIEETFRRGHALLIPWSNPERERIGAAMAEITGYLARLPSTPSFGGINALDADRQTLWVASTGLRNPFHMRRDDLLRFDGDAEGGERGLEALKHESVSDALEDLKRVLDDALEMAGKAIGLHEDLPTELVEKITVRYRAIRYAPVERDVAGIGFHPDGNVLSAEASYEFRLTFGPVIPNVLRWRRSMNDNEAPQGIARGDSFFRAYSRTVGGIQILYALFFGWVALSALTSVIQQEGTFKGHYMPRINLPALYAGASVALLSLSGLVSGCGLVGLKRWARRWVVVYLALVSVATAATAASEADRGHNIGYLGLFFIILALPYIPFMLSVMSFKSGRRNDAENRQS